MTDLFSASLLDGLPYILRQQPEVRAMAYALQNFMGIIRKLIAQTRVFTSDEALTHAVCDRLAVEWRVPQYSEEYSISVKRELIKSTLSVYSNAGTKAAVENLVSTIFGSAEVEEWFEYGGEPCHFTITTDNPDVNSGDVAEFKAAAERLKRLSAWLDEIVLALTVETQKLYGGCFIREYSEVEFVCDG